MISYHPVQYRPLRYAPNVQIRPGLRLDLGQAAPGAYLTPGKIKAVSGLAGAALLALSAATVWVGVDTGLKRKGLLKVAGWVVAGAGAVAGLINLAGTIGVVAMPTADIQAAIDQGKANAAASAVPTTSQI